MRDFQSLDKGLLNSEFELGRELFEKLRAQGWAPFKTAALIYRHGYLDGRESKRRDIDHICRELAMYKQKEKAAVQSPPEANKEGSAPNE